MLNDLNLYINNHIKVNRNCTIRWLPFEKVPLKMCLLTTIVSKL